MYKKLYDNAYKKRYALQLSKGSIEIIAEIIAEIYATGFVEGYIEEQTRSELLAHKMLETGVLDDYFEIMTNSALREMACDKYGISEEMVLKASQKRKEEFRELKQQWGDTN